MMRYNDAAQRRGRAPKGETMPTGPEGQWRPADPIAGAVHVAKLATGEIQETRKAPPRPDPVADSRRASVAGKARSAQMTSDQRSALGRAGAAARWDAKSR